MIDGSLTCHQKSFLSLNAQFSQRVSTLLLYQRGFLLHDSHIVASIEDGLKHVPADAASGIRQRVVSLLRKVTLPRNNVTRKESAAIRQLKQESQLAIVPADKGRATVVMDQRNYDDKMHSLLSD